LTLHEAVLGGELKQLASHRLRETIDARDTVAHFDDLTDLRNLELARILLNFLSDDSRNLVGFDLHRCCLVAFYRDSV